jgi:hypothetical protein
MASQLGLDVTVPNTFQAEGVGASPALHGILFITGLQEHPFRICRNEVAASKSPLVETQRALSFVFRFHRKSNNR